jgi:hypothetical protein
MAFFDKKQEVIDIKLTQFGKNLLARGRFAPKYYDFFDDDILYNGECAGIVEEQNRTEERIEESQRLKTQHTSIPLSKTHDQNENPANPDSPRTMPEIGRRQEPHIAEKLLRYTLKESVLHSSTAPHFNLSMTGPSFVDIKDDASVGGIELPIPQLNFTSSYELREERVNTIEVPEHILDSENYIDLTSDIVNFLDGSKLEIRSQEVVIDLEEFGVDYSLDNFEFEIFEIIEEGETEQLVKLEKKSEIQKYFDIKVDSMATETDLPPRNGRRRPRGRT